MYDTIDVINDWWGEHMSKPIIYITRNMPEHLLTKYKDHLQFNMWESDSTPVPMDVLHEETKKADSLLCLLTETIDRSFIEAQTHLKIIANMAVGYVNIDVQAANDHNIIVTNTPEALTETTADLAFTLLMATARRMTEASRYIYEDQWDDWSQFMLAGTDVYNKMIVRAGMRCIGLAVARRTKGFNMEMLYHNRSRNEEAEADIGATYVSFNELLEQSDYVVSVVPLTEETEDLFDEYAFQKMKRSGIFINISRGGVVDERALYDALKNRVIRAAGLDVFKNEPIDSTHPFTTLENVVLLPHIGSATIETRENMFTLCLDNILNVFQGKEPLTPVK